MGVGVVVLIILIIVLIVVILVTVIIVVVLLVANLAILDSFERPQRGAGHACGALWILTQKIYMICVKTMGKHAQSFDTLLLERIHSHGAGWVFTPSHFAELGTRNAVASALKRHKKAGTIRQIARGLYEVPRLDPELGPLSPSIEAVAKALQERDAVRLQPAGGYAANLLGLSEQVPTKVVFLTDGPARRVQIGRQLIVLKHTTPRNMATAGRVSGLVIQALRHLGRRGVDDAVIRRLRARLSDADKDRLLQDLRYAPAWIAAVMRRLAGRARGES